MIELEGIVPPVPTPYGEDGEVDTVKFRDYLKFLKENGIHGIFLLGTNGEGPLLEFPEKRKVIDTAVDTLKGDIPTIAGTACASTREAIRIGEYAEDAGADAIHAVTPYYYPADGRGMIEHYSSIAESVDLPLFIYHIPSRTGNKISIDALLELAEIPNIVGLKDSSKDLAWFNEVVSQITEKREDFTFFAGSDAYIYFMLELGASGAVSAVANVFPEIVTELYEKYKEGNREKARDLQERVLKIRGELKRGPYMSGVKAALKLRGRDLGGLRSPLSEMKKEEKEELKKGLRDLGLI